MILRMDKKDRERIRKLIYEDLTKFDMDILRILSGDLLVAGKCESIEVMATKEHMIALTRLMILGFTELKKRQNGKYLLKVSKLGRSSLRILSKRLNSED